jgi:hypothetical protein
VSHLRFRPAAAVPLLLGLSALGPVPARTQQQEEGGATLRVNAAEISINGRVQTQFNTTSAAGEPDAEWLLRRVRLEAKVRVNDLVSGTVQPDFAGNRVTVRDAYLRLSFSPGAQIVAGQAFRPFSLLTRTSSILMLPVERGLRIRGVDALDEYSLVSRLGYAERDVGVQLMGQPSGAPLGLEYAAGIFNGPGRSEAASSAVQQYVARLAVAPLPRLRLGGAWSRRGFARPDTAAGAPPHLERGQAWEVDMEYGAFEPGLHLLAEATTGDLDPFSGARFGAAQAWLGYRTPQLGPRLAFVEPVARISYARVDERDGISTPSGGLLLTPGVNLYLDRLNRVMVNYDVWQPHRGGPREGSFKAMFQLAF